MDRIGVVGGGTMGTGIAQVFLAAGAQVTVAEANDDLAARARDRIEASLRKAGELGKLGDVEGAVGRLAVVSEIPEGADLVIEAVPEDAALKKAVLARLEASLVATNTSSLSIDGLAGAVPRPERFLGLHFFNPVPQSALVEIVVGTATAPEAVAAARDWVARIGKESIEVRDSPGFATSRLGVALGLEAIRMVEDGVASPEDIDKGMVLGYRHPMGPLRLSDLVGLDVRLAIAEYLASTLGPRFEPPRLMREMVERGELGQKTGKGFYTW